MQVGNLKMIIVYSVIHSSTGTLKKKKKYLSKERLQENEAETFVNKNCQMVLFRCLILSLKIGLNTVYCVNTTLDFRNTHFAV